MSDQIDPLLASIKGLLAVTVEVTPDLEELVFEEAELFLRAGGTVDLDLWTRLSQVSREALARAGDSIRRCQAGLTGLATQGPQVARSIAEGEDAGDFKVRTALDASINRMAEQLDKEAPDG